MHLFPTGQGNVIGNPILPVIKLCANPRTVRTMSEHVDVDVSGLLRKEMNPDQAGDALLECMFRTANGRLTAAEALGHREFVLTRLVRDALEDLLQVRVWRGGAEGAFQASKCRATRARRCSTWSRTSSARSIPTLAYRFACRVGMCGSCAMTVNGVPRWTCRTHVDKVVQERRHAKSRRCATCR